jgi:hypothetical protein
MARPKGYHRDPLDPYHSPEFQQPEAGEGWLGDGVRARTQRHAADPVATPFGVTLGSVCMSGGGAKKALAVGPAVW